MKVLLITTISKSFGFFSSNCSGPITVHYAIHVEFVLLKYTSRSIFIAVVFSPQEHHFTWELLLPKHLQINLPLSSKQIRTAGQIPISTEMYISIACKTNEPFSDDSILHSGKHDQLTTEFTLNGIYYLFSYLERQWTSADSGSVCLRPKICWKMHWLQGFLLRI